MAASGALGMALGSLNFGLFIKPMGDELGIGRAVFGWAQSTRLVASAVTAPIVGNLLDRIGARLLLALAALITGVALVGLGFITTSWQMVVLFGVMGLVGMSGPGTIVTSVPVTKWFVRQRGKALAFTSLGVPIGGLVFVPLTQILIDAVGWRLAWVVLGLVGAGCIVPLALLFVRRQPEDLGLLPDGATAIDPTAPKAAPAAPDERSWTRAEALRTPTFWRLVAVFSLVMLATSSVGVHRIPSFMDRGFDPWVVSLATAVDGAAAGLSTFVMGLLARRMPPRFVGAGGFLLLAVASLMTIVAADYPAMIAAMVAFGLGIGVLVLMQTLLWADYFGREHQGSIRGVVMPITLLFGAAGAPVAGAVRDATGSYDSIWLMATGLMVLGALLLALTPSPPAPPHTLAVVARPAAADDAA